MILSHKSLLFLIFIVMLQNSGHARPVFPTETTPSSPDTSHSSTFRLLGSTWTRDGLTFSEIIAKKVLQIIQQLHLALAALQDLSKKEEQERRSRAAKDSLSAAADDMEKHPPPSISEEKKDSISSSLETSKTRGAPMSEEPKTDMKVVSAPII